MADFFKSAAQAGSEVRRLGQVPPNDQRDPWLTELGELAVEGMNVVGPIAHRNGITPPSQREAATTGVPSAIQEYLAAKAKEAEQAPAAPPANDSTYIGDLGRSLGRGVIGVGKSAYEIGNLATFGGLDSATKSAFGTSGTEALSNATNSLNKGDSTALQQQRAELEAADGFWSSMGVVLTNPKLMGSMVFEMGPQMVSVLGAAKTVATRTLASQLSKGVAKEAAEASAQKAATLTIMGVNPAMEAGMAASDVRSTVLQMGEADLQASPHYQALLAQGYKPEDARGRLANDAAMFAAAVTAPISLASNAITARFEAKLATGQVGKQFGLKALGKEVGEGLLKEPVQEGIEEGGSQFGQNVGLKYSGAKPNQDLMEGVAQSAGAGAALGAVAGAGFGAANARFGTLKDPNKPTPETPETPAGTPATPGTTGAAPADVGGAGEATAAERPVGLTLTDQEFAGIIQSNDAVPYLTHLWAASDDNTRTQIQEIARRYNIMDDFSETSQNPDILAKGVEIATKSGDQLANAFLNKTSTELEKQDVTPLPPPPASVDDLMNQEASINQDYDPADAAIDSFEAAGVKPKQGAVVETPNVPAGATNVSTVLPAEQTGQTDASAAQTDVAPTPTPTPTFESFRADLTQNARDKGVPVKDTDYVEVPVPAEIKAIGDALNIPIYGYRYTGKSKKLQMLKGISSANGIGINANAKAGHLNVLGHEVYHQLAQRDPAAAAKLNGLIQQYLSEEGKAKYAAWLKDSAYDPAKFDEEMAADVLGVLFTDSQFWAEVNAQNPTLLETILSIVSDLIAKLKLAVNSQEMYTKRGRAMQSFIKDYDAVRKMLAQFVADTAKKPKAETAPIDQMVEPTTPQQLEVFKEFKKDHRIDNLTVEDLLQTTFASHRTEENEWELLFTIPEKFKNSYTGNKLRHLVDKDALERFRTAFREVPDADATWMYLDYEAATPQQTVPNKGTIVPKEGTPKEVTPPTSYQLTPEQAQRREELRSRASSVFIAGTINPSQMAQIDKILGYDGNFTIPQPAKFDLIEEILAKPEADMASNKERVAAQGVTDEQLQEVRDAQIKKTEAPAPNPFKGLDSSRTQIMTDAQALLNDGRLSDAEMYKIEMLAMANQPNNQVNMSQILEAQNIVRQAQGRPIVEATTGRMENYSEFIQQWQEAVAKRREELNKTREMLQQYGGPEYNSKYAKEFGNDVKQPKSFAGRAQFIMSQMFSPAKAKAQILRLERLMKNWGTGKTKDIRRSDAEYIFSQFGQVGALSENEAEELRRADDRQEMRTNLARKVNELQGKDLNQRAEAVLLNIHPIAQELADLRAEMEKAGVPSKDIDKVLLDKEIGVEALIQNMFTPTGHAKVAELANEMASQGADAATVRFSSEQRALELGKFEEEIGKIKQNLIDMGVPAEQVERTMATVQEAAPQVNEPVMEQGDLFGDVSVATAQLVDALTDGKTGIENPRVLATLMREAKYAKVGLLDVLNELRLRNIQLKAPIEAAIQRPGISYGLEYWLKKSENKGRNPFVLRQEWLASLDAGLRDVEGIPAAQEAILRDLSEAEKLIFDQWKSDMDQMRNRLKEAKRRDTQERYVHTSLDTAFPNALFNKFTLEQMRDPTKLAENDSAMLRYLTSDSDKTLADVWLDDLNYAWDARRDLRDQMTELLSEAEMNRFMDWRKVRVANEAKANLGDLRANAARLVMAQRGLIDEAAVSDSLNRILAANENELLPIVQAAYELAEANRASDPEAARDATLDAIEAQDNESINSDAPIDEEFSQDEPVNEDEDTEEESVGDLSLMTSESMPIPGSKVVVEPEVGDANADPAKIYEQLRLRSVREKRGAHSGVVYASVITDHLNAVTAKWKSRPEFQVVRNIGQLPKALRDAILAKSGGMVTKGAISPDGKIYLFSDAMENIEDAEFTFFHEVYGHRGLRGFLGDKLNTFLETQYKLNQRVREAADKLIAEAKELGRGMTTLEATEEAIADLAVNNQEPGLFIKILDALKRFFRSIGMNSVADWMQDKSYRNLAYVLSSVRKAVREGNLSPLDGAPSDVRLNANSPAVEIFATNNGKTTAYALFNGITNNWTVFYNKDGLAPGKFGIQTFDNYADALNLARQHGKVVSSKDHPLRQHKGPSNFNKIKITNPSDVKSLIRKFKLYVGQKYLPVYEVVDQIIKQGGTTNLIQKLVLYRGRIKPYFDQFQREYLRPIAAALKTIEKNGDSLEFRGETFQGVELVDLYLTALHASERNDAIKNLDPNNKKGSGMTDDEAEMILRKADGLQSITEIKTISTKMQKLSKVKIAYMLSTGLITEQQAIALDNYMFYVNLSGNKADETSGEFVDKKVLGQSSITLNSNDAKRAKGRESLAVNVLENTMNAYMATVVHGQANVVKQAVVQMVNDVNDPGFAAINPFKFAKVLNMDRLINDKNILKTIGGKGTTVEGRRVMLKMKTDMEVGLKTADEVANELTKILQEAHEQGKINSNQLAAYAQTVKNATENGLNGANFLSKDGYVTYQEDTRKHDKDNVIVAKFGGKPVAAEFFEGVDNGDRFGTFMSALRGDITPPDSPVGEFIGKWNRVVGQLITSRNLAWVPVNWMRDIGAAYFNAANDPRVGKELAKKMRNRAASSYGVAMKNLIGDDYMDKNGPVYSFIKRFFKKPVSAEDQRMWNEFKRSGAEVFFMDRKDMKEQIAEMQKEIDPETGLRGTWDAYAKFTDFLGMPAEASARFAAYRTLREAGWSVEEAGTYAKEITVNFEQTGALRSLRTWFMFANPSIQGTTRMFRDAYTMKKVGDYSIPVPTPQMMKMVGALAGFGFIMGFIARAIGDNGDDEVNDLDQIPRYKRATSVVIAPAMPLGAPLPLPYGWNVFYAMGNFAADSMFGKTPVTQTASRIATSAVDAFWPLGQSESGSVFGTAVKMLTPTPISPILDIAMNESKFGGPIAKGDNPFVRANESNAYSNFSSASPISVFAARTINEIFGGNQYRSGGLGRDANDRPILSLDLNPAWLDYLGASYLPGPITDVGRGVNLTINAAMGKDIKNPPYPLIDRFSTRISDGWNRGAYERAITFVDTKVKEAQSMPLEKRKEIVAQYPNVAGAKDALGNIDSDLRKLRTNLRKVEESEHYTRSEKIEYRNGVERLEKEYYKRAVSIALKAGFRDQILADQ